MAFGLLNLSHYCRPTRKMWKEGDRVQGGNFKGFGVPPQIVEDFHPLSMK